MIGVTSDRPSRDGAKPGGDDHTRQHKRENLNCSVWAPSCAWADAWRSVSFCGVGCSDEDLVIRLTCLLHPSSVAETVRPAQPGNAHGQVAVQQPTSPENASENASEVDDSVEAISFAKCRADPDGALTELDWACGER